MTRCRRCGRTLTDPESIKRRLGVECLGKNATPRMRLLEDLEAVKGDDALYAKKLLARLEAGARLTKRQKRYAERLHAKQRGRLPMVSNVSHAMPDAGETMHPENSTEATQ